MNKSAHRTTVTYSKPAEIGTGTFAGYYAKAMSGQRIAVGKAPAKGKVFMPFAIVTGDSIRWVNRPHFAKLVEAGKAKVTPEAHFTA